MTKSKNNRNRGKRKSQVKGAENIFKTLIEENFPNLKREKPIKVQDACKIPNGLDQRRNSPCHIIIKTLSVQNT